MVEDRRIVPGRRRRVATLLAALVLAATGPARGDDTPPIRLADAAQRGLFNVGASTGSVDRVADRKDALLLRVADPRDVLVLDYSLPTGTAVGVWAKAFPAGLAADRVDVVRSSARDVVPGRVAATLEIKGSAGVQRITLDLAEGWTPRETFVDWKAIGVISEVVVSINRAGGVGNEPAVGTLFLDVRFERLTSLRKLGASRGPRFVGVLLVGLVAATLAGLLRLASGGLGGPAGTSGMRGLGRDVVLGAGVVGIVGLSAMIYRLGGMGALEVGWLPVGAAVAGVLLAAWWKFGLVGTHLTPAEAFLDATATGLLAASSSPLAILQPAADWSQMLWLSQSVAAVVALLYHGANARRLASAGKHLGIVVGALILGLPYAVGGLTLLEPGGLIHSLGDLLTAGTLESRPALAEFAGRALVLFAFNELVANALGLATRRTLLRSGRAHLALLVVAVGAVAGPWVAWYGSGPTVDAWPALVRLVGVVATTALSQAGLWAEGYLLTGMVLDAIHGAAPTGASAVGHPVLGLKKGMVYSGTFMALLNLIAILVTDPHVHRFALDYPLLVGAMAGAVAFPMAKTIVETFDGSQSFFRRVGMSYRTPILSLRGALIGVGLAYAFAHDMPREAMSSRVVFGLLVGAAAFAGVNLILDAFAGRAGRGRVQSWRVYAVQGMLGGFIGAALGFYLDAAQVAVVIAKFHRYVDPGQAAHLYDRYPLLSRWGNIRLGDERGGPSLLLAEALAGVVSWAIPSWLFAINRTFMAAYFDKDASPIRALFTRAGMVQLVESMIGVLRWGLWMSPIIESFLRKMGEPTWYNQDGAIRTLIATVHDASTSQADFRAWSLGVFIALLAHDGVRVLIWLDHFGLRVATLVNLSFLGMDKLDRRLARFLAPAATARCIPEGVKRFTTWAPLLIPFYLPQGANWDLAWGRAESIRAGEHGGPIEAFAAATAPSQLLLLAGAVVATSAAFAASRRLRGLGGARKPPDLVLANAAYEVTVRPNGEALGRIKGRDFDLSRRSYDLLDPAGRTLFLVDLDGDDPRVAWPLLGNFPPEAADRPQIDRGEGTIRITSTARGIRATIAIEVPEGNDAAELWTVRLENLADGPRRLKVVPYLEWVLNRPDADRGHTQYNRLFAEVEYVAGLHAVLAWDKHAKVMGLLAADVAPEGFLSARVDFIGRARSLWSPRALETLAFAEARDTDAHPTFDPIGSLLLGATLPARGAGTIRLLLGAAADKRGAIDLVARHLLIPLAGAVPDARRRKAVHSIGHGEIPPGTPEPYCAFSDDGRRMMVRTPFTPRPFDHTMSNGLGHVVVVTNRGLHTSSSVNSQQNRLTPDWSDTVTREVPSEAIYLHDPDTGEWFSPTYHPLNDPDADHEAEFGVDGSATFAMSKGTISTELTVFVPPDEPAGVYRLTVRNSADVPRRLRVAPYFQMVLAGQPEYAGPLQVRHDPALNALFFANPRNTFRSGPAFAAMSADSVALTTERGRFFGEGLGVARPTMVDRGAPEPGPAGDDRPVAAFLGELQIPARGEATVVIVLGQADDRDRAEAVIRKYRDPAEAAASLDATRAWWSGLMDTVSVETDSPEFDRYLPWLKYQALAERIWARRGFYQASGAFGFRDQLQDSVNLLWVDPTIARRQILLHASQQFLEGDVVHWFHLLADGRTGFSGRTHASDNLLWLAWGVVEYVGATGDDSILDERTPYLESDLPFEPLPAGKEGMGFDPLRSSREDSVYRHCLRAIDLVLDRRMGAHGLPLMGTGDWNDGLDAIGSEGKGESVWLGLFLHYILTRMIPIAERKEGLGARYAGRSQLLAEAIEATWRGDRYLRAYHDDGTEIGVKGSGVWEIDALMAAWAVMSGINPARGKIVFETALATLEKDKAILLGWPPLREDTHPYLGRSSAYPEGVRENGMYCHGVQWLVGAARVLADQAGREGRPDEARHYVDTAHRLWLKITPIPHAVPGEIETYGGQPNQQAADMVTTFDPGRMIWNGYTGAAGWIFRQAMEGVLGMRLDRGAAVGPAGPMPAPSELGHPRVARDLSRSPFRRGAGPA